MEKQIEHEKHLKENGINPDDNVLLPQYEFDEILQVYREINKPSEDLFMAVGYNSQDVITKYDQASDNPIKKNEHKSVTSPKDQQKKPVEEVKGEE